MTLRGWYLFVMAAFFPSVHLQRNDGSIQPQEVQIYRPELQPSEATPRTGTYTVNNRAGKPCIKATMGAEYIVIEKERTWYFNLDPSMVRTGGVCGEKDAVLSLSLPEDTASLQFTFTQDHNNNFYVTKLAADLSPWPVCQGCANKTYSGEVAHQKLFTAQNGQSFTCKSENLLLTSSELRIKLVALQIQAFSVAEGRYGEEVECWPDFNKRVIPIIIEATVVGLALIILLTSLFIKDRRRQGYTRL